METRLDHYLNMHKHLSMPEIRDFLSNSIAEAHKISIPMHIRETELVKIRQKYKGLEWRIAHTEYSIKCLERDLSEATHLKAVLTIIEGQGWQEWDVSDHIVWKDKESLGHSFIGTEIEKEEYLDMIENEK